MLNDQCLSNIVILHLDSKIRLSGLGGLILMNVHATWLSADTPEPGRGKKDLSSHALSAPPGNPANPLNV